MKFSVVTPSYNQGRFLRDCVESVLAQRGDGVQIEHIIVDACSTDETLAILSEYPHLTWTSEPDKGQTDAINKGFRRATGDWVMWLNCDDYLQKGALARIREAVAAHPHTDVFYGDCLFVDESGKLLREKREFVFDYWMLLFYGCYIPSTATFLSRRVIEEGPALDSSLKVCMDFDYYLRLAEAGFVFRHIPEALASFRWHGSNVSTLHNDKRIEERFTLQKAHLALHGLDWLARKPVLAALRKFYEAKRVLMRLGRNLGGR